MSQIELSEKTRAILELTIPEWTKKLSEVNFDGGKLESEQQKSMNNANRCYIGELHDKDRYYNGCGVCWILALLAPHVFKTELSEEHYNNNIETCRDEGLDFEDISSPDVIPDKFLKYIADHVREEHGDIITECWGSK